MRACISLMLVFACTVAVAAEPFDGSQPLACSVSNGHDCLPSQSECKLMTPDKYKTPVIEVDFAKKEVRSPFRTASLSVTHSNVTSESLVLQGADLLFAWSALIKKKTGSITIAITDREGAYVIFGSCRSVAIK